MRLIEGDLDEVWVINKAAAELERLRAEVERLRADAERWRYLRDIGHDADGGLLMLVHATADRFGLLRFTCEASDYDAAIDAARSAQEPTKD